MNGGFIYLPYAISLLGQCVRTMNCENYNRTLVATVVGCRSPEAGLADEIWGCDSRPGRPYGYGPGVTSTPVFSFCSDQTVTTTPIPTMSPAMGHSSSLSGGIVAVITIVVVLVVASVVLLMTVMVMRAVLRRHLKNKSQASAR